MKYLLDTATLIWFLTGDTRLPTEARMLIKNPKSRLAVSSVSFLEIAIKMSIGKLDIPDIDIDNLPFLLTESGVDILVLEPFESIKLHSLPAKENHRDPFDRMLICQAIERKLTLISPDSKFDRYIKDGLSLYTC